MAFFYRKGFFFSSSKTVFRGINSKFQPYSKEKRKKKYHSTYYLLLGGEINTSSTALPTQKSWSFVNKETWLNWKSPPHTQSCPWGKIRKEWTVTYRSESYYSVTPMRHSYAVASSINPGRLRWPAGHARWCHGPTFTSGVSTWSYGFNIHLHVCTFSKGDQVSQIPTCHNSRKPLWRTRREGAQIPAKERENAGAANRRCHYC